MIKSVTKNREAHALRRLLLACAHILLIVGLLFPVSVANADDPVPTPTLDKEVPPRPPPGREPLAPTESSSGFQARDGRVNVIIVLKAQPLHEIAAQVQADFEPSLELLRRQIQEVHATAAPSIPEQGWATREEELAATQMRGGIEQPVLPSEGERVPTSVGAGLTAEQLAQTRDLSAQMEVTMQSMRREIVRRAQPEIEASQAELVQWLESVGAIVHSRVRVVNAVAAAVPQAQLDVLRARPDVAEVSEDQLMWSLLDDSHYAIDQDTWQGNGYAGGVWDLGVIDSGVDRRHPRLDHLGWSSRVCLAAAGNPWWDNSSDDVNGHGTHVAGIVVNNDGTYWGIAWDTNLALNLKAGYDLDGSDGGGAQMATSDQMDCVDWALTTAPDDADAFNLSYGGCASDDDSPAARFWDAVVSDMLTPAAIAAGNYDPFVPCSRYIASPAIAYNVLSVANVDDRNTASASSPRRGDDVINASSSWGPTPGLRRKPDIAAPGTNIRSTNNNWEGTSPNWVEYSGTSMAAPHVAGALLLLEEYGILDPHIQKAVLISAAQDKGSAGWDPQYGWGYIDLGHAWTHRNDWFSSSLSPAPDYRLYKGRCYSDDTAALVWNRRVVYNGDSYPSTYYTLSDLDLYMYNEADDSYVDTDTSTADNVHVVECDQYYSGVVIKVDAYSSSFAGASTEPYALATEELFSAASGPAFSLGTSNYSRCVGSQWTANVTVNNDGDLAAHNVNVSLSIPAGLSIVSGSNPQNLGSIRSGYGKSASWTLRADQAGTYSVPVNVSSSSYRESFTGSGSFSVGVSTVPSAPSLMSPSDGSSTCDATPAFDWSSVSGATSYRIQVDNNSGFTSPEIDTTSASSDYTPTSALSPGTYYWRVGAYNSCGDSSWSASRSFTILSKPSTPSLMSPSNGSGTCDATPAFDWSPVSGATSYRIQVDNNSGFTSPEIDTTSASSDYTPTSALSPGTYYWRVLSSSSCGDSSWSARRSFTILSEPSTPSLMSPSDGSGTCDATPAFDWSSVSGATSYRIQVDNDSGFASPEIDTTSASFDYTPTSALSPGTYYWRVQASNSCGDGSWSESSSFTILSKPSTPSLMSPSDGSGTCGTTPAFDWSSVSGATSYRIQVDNNSSFASPEIDTITASSEYTPTLALSPGTYYWRVLSSNSCGDSSWSASWSFTILSAPSAPSLSSPLDGSLSSNSTLTFSWGSVSGATSYRIQVDNDSKFSSPEIDQVSSSTSYTPGTGLVLGTYYWRVRSINACGQGTWSSAWSFTITNNPPNLPSNPSPTDGSTNQDLDVDLTWTCNDPDPGDTVTYDVYFEADDDTPDNLICNDVATPACDPGRLDPDTHYYWYVVVTDNQAASSLGDIWDFTTKSAIYLPLILKNY
jgi:serine protease AprX